MQDENNLIPMSKESLDVFFGAELPEDLPEDEGVKDDPADDETRDEEKDGKDEDNGAGEDEPKGKETKTPKDDSADKEAETPKDKISTEQLRDFYDSPQKIIEALPAIEVSVVDKDGNEEVVEVRSAEELVKKASGKNFASASEERRFNSQLEAIKDKVRDIRDGIKSELQSRATRDSRQAQIEADGSDIDELIEMKLIAIKKNGKPSDATMDLMKEIDGYRVNINKHRAIKGSNPISYKQAFLEYRMVHPDKFADGNGKTNPKDGEKQPEKKKKALPRIHGGSTNTGRPKMIYEPGMSVDQIVDKIKREI